MSDLFHPYWADGIHRENTEDNLPTLDIGSMEDLSIQDKLPSKDFWNETGTFLQDEINTSSKTQSAETHSQINFDSQAE